MIHQSHPGRRLLFPNEHGAWGMFFTAFLIGWVAAPILSWHPLFLLPASLGAFLARYPAGLYFKKRRVARAMKIPLTREKGWFFFYGSLTTLFAVPLFSHLHWWWLIPFAGFSLILFFLHLKSIKKRQERSLSADLTAMAGLSLITPVASLAAEPHAYREAFLLWALFVSFFAQRVVTIRRLIRRRHEVPMDIRGLGKRELFYSLLFTIVVVLIFRIVHA